MRPKVMARKKRDPRIGAAFNEVFSNVPKTVKATGKTGDAKRSMMTAVALSKARAAGARIPKKGGNTDLDVGSMKYQFALGRRDNLAAKAAFRTGPVARVDANAGSLRRRDPAAAEVV
jgi:hypothetical protein